METARTGGLNSCVVNEQQTIDPQLFVELVREPLQRRDTNALARLIQDRWSHGQIVRLLESPDADARKLAALALGFVGDRRSIPIVKPVIDFLDLWISSKYQMPSKTPSAAFFLPRLSWRITFDSS